MRLGFPTLMSDGLPGPSLISHVSLLWWGPMSYPNAALTPFITTNERATAGLSVPCRDGFAHHGYPSAGPLSLHRY
jgi:hypothetical protein